MSVLYEVPMVASKRFRDLGMFPLDSNDYVELQGFVRDDSINFYLRVFHDQQFRTVFMVGEPRNLEMLWSTFQTGLGRLTTDTIDETIEGFLLKQVYQAFSQAGLPPRPIYQRGD